MKQRTLKRGLLCKNPTKKDFQRSLFLNGGCGEGLR